MDEPTELERIATRIAARNAANTKDRKRQREIVRELHGTMSWDDLQAQARVSRPTIARWVRPR